MDLKKFRRAFFVLLAVIVLGIIAANVVGAYRQGPQWSLTQVAKAAKEGRIARIDVTGNDNIRVTLDDGSVVYSTKDPSSSAIEQLAALGVSQDELTAIEWNTGTNWDNVITVCAYLVPLAAFLGAFAWLLRRAMRIQPTAQSPGTPRKGGTQDDKPNH